MKNFITEFNPTGICTIDTTLVIKQWTDKFFISQWKDEFTLYRVIRKNGKQRVRISQLQADELITILELVQVKDSTFASGSTWHTRQYAKQMVDKYQKLYEEKLQESIILSEEINSWRRALK